MARRSTLKTEVPKAILAEFNARLIDDGFSDYTGMTDWLNSRLSETGLELKIGRSAVYRHGRAFQEEFEADMAESRQLYHVAKASLESNDDPEGVVREATIRALQTRLLKLAVALREAEEAGDDPHLLAETTAKIAKAVADLGRADIASRKFNAEREKEIRAEERAAAAEAATDAGRKSGVSPEGIAAIRAAIASRMMQ
ncbi:Protein of unknown function [Methylomagnum ishizawai]|uniref:Phage terminase, small subunit n=1 Tax=Methylomagnum ishizawai TaxID=1760988 RepID=A0A1Y6CUL0_9GAMM|nr:phage protein Gp27 family protein [Methylomagnum ishizawai]SMF94318.1 Protein of unknown function [Methylomagnum ishizawai]